MIKKQKKIKIYSVLRNISYSIVKYILINHSLNDIKWLEMLFFLKMFSRKSLLTLILT